MSFMNLLEDLVASKWKGVRISTWINPGQEYDFILWESVSNLVYFGNLFPNIDLLILQTASENIESDTTPFVMPMVISYEK